MNNWLFARVILSGRCIYS